MIRVVPKADERAERSDTYRGKLTKNISRISKTSKSPWRMLEEESDEEMRELAKEELNESRAKSRRTRGRIKDPVAAEGPER